MRGTIIPRLFDFISEKRITLCSVKLRHHLGVDAANHLVGSTKSVYYETDNRQQQEHHEQEIQPEAGHEKQEGGNKRSP